MKIKKITKKIKNKKNEVGRKSKINRRQINRNISNKKTMKGGDPVFDYVSNKILTKEILNENILKEIDRSPKDFKDYLIDKYYKIFHLEKKYNDGKLKPAYIEWNNDIISLTEKIFNKIIKDVEEDYDPKNKYIILAPGDTPSKIVAFMNLIKKKYFEKLKEYNIHIVSFPMSKASKWDIDTSKQYIKEQLRGYIDFEKKETDKVYFGILDAIDEGSTLKKLNETLTALDDWNNFIVIEKIPDGLDRYEINHWSPKFGYNLAHSGIIFVNAELYPESIPPCRCTPNYEVEKYKSKEIDEKKFKNNLYNCNIYLYYWYCYWSKNNNVGNGAAGNRASAGNGATL
jgi:hypothetical protein